MNNFSSISHNFISNVIDWLIMFAFAELFAQSSVNIYHNLYLFIVDKKQTTIYIYLYD